MNKGFLILLCSTLILTIGLITLVIQNQKVSENILDSGSVSDAGGARASITKSTSESPNPAKKIAYVENQIEAALNSGNTQALESYMTQPTVAFILMSSSCCEPQTPEQAVAQLDYVKEGAPFDFNQQSETVKNLKTNNERLQNAFIGISKNGEQLAAFNIDIENKISDIELSVSWKLYNN